MALRVGATTALVVLLAIISTAVIFDRQQLSEIRSRTETTARTADDVVDSPPGMWLVKLTDSGHEATRTMPTDLLAQVVAYGRDMSGQTSFEAGGRMWPAWVDQREGASYVAVYDFRLHTGEEQRLLMSTIAAGIVGVLLAALTGLLAGRRAVRPLGEAMELQRQFVADASHELRTPLAVISTRAQMLRRHVAVDAAAGGGDPAAARRLAEVDQLVHDTQAMADVVSDLLLSAQLEHVDEVAERVDLGALASEVVTSLMPYAAEHGVTLVDEGGQGAGVRAAAGGGGAVGAAAGARVVEGVGPSLRRSVLALVDNAIAHSDKGSRVEVRSSVAGDQVRVDVIDHGEGVEVADIDRLTRRFSRGDGGSGGRRVGLGLALVTQIVRSHGGRLDVADTPGGGATFTILIPAAPED
ncbi:HAMP domain-containing sensor histidine kinase [Terrabacter carboxydivorans]|uniref:Sensor-like histidine kinase SenX3 n=1 Tax=Terrabacter carboxydivorans TaxID=619730 RepID=A0ABN3LVN2_9MICO